MAVHNFYTPFLFFLRKTALRQVVHRDVTRPHFVRSSHLPKSAELAKAILTTINSAIKKSHTRWLLLMAGTTRLSWVARVKRQFRILLLGLCPIAKLLQPLLAPRSNSIIRSRLCRFLGIKKEGVNTFSLNGGNDEARTRDLMRDRHAL